MVHMIFALPNQTLHGYQQDRRCHPQRYAGVQVSEDAIYGQVVLRPRNILAEEGLPDNRLERGY